MAGFSNEQKTRRVGDGTPGPGRPKGLPNKTTKLAKEAIAEAFEKLGGTKALADWAMASDDNRRVFYSSLYTKLIPVQTELTGKDGGAIQYEQKVVEDAHAVAGRIAGLVARSRADAVASGTHH